MWILVAGLIVFLGGHLVPALPSLRERLVGSVGEGAYKLGFAALSIIGLALIAYGFAQARPAAADLWIPPDWTKHVAMLLMLFSFVFLAATYIPSRIRDVLRHPMLVAIKIWALAHLIANGDSASALLFIAFLAYAVFDRISFKRRPAATRATAGTAMGDVIAGAVGAGAYLLFVFYGHEWLIGVPLVG